ncbi:tetratricopeptide repeat protein [Aerosakkonemataceae cyanobacterium BLCC-F154]|uniref:Tetratricopeptide repeat protein n=1 Tax=Floridaenema fluviatile BLCC-F154 TaxID=3153640 RepID=A0ABV4YFP5_9CYAN
MDIIIIIALIIVLIIVLYATFNEDKTLIDSLQNIIIITLALVIAKINVFKIIYECIYDLFKKNYPCPVQKLEFIGTIVLLAISFVLIKLVFFDLIAQKFKKLRLFLLFLFGFLLVKVWSTSCTEQSNCDPKNFLICKISSVVCKSMDFLTAKNVLQFTNILQTITIILIVIILCLFYRELSRPSGIVIRPFEHEQLDKEKKILVDGKFIAELLAAELHHIEHIYNSLEDGQLKIKPGSSLAAVCREDIKFPLAVFKGDNLETAFSAMGSISVPNQLSLQIGSLLLTLKQLWPQGTVQIISGRIKRDNLSLQITARYEKSNHKSEVHAYKVPSESTEFKTPQISDLIEELAYRIVLDLSPKVSKTSSWKAFKFYTQALYCICQYERTKSAKKLDDARTLCEDASRIDKNFSKLGDLLSLIGFYYLSADQYLKAKSTLTEAMKINPNSYLVRAVYGHQHYYLGDYKRALEYYKQAQNLEPSRYEFYIRIGVLNAISGEYEDARESLERSKYLEFQNHAADSALAWIDFLTYLEELEEPKGKLYSAYNNLRRMGQEKTNIDYSNLAVVLLYLNRIKKNPDEETKTLKEAHENWKRSLELCPDETISDQLKRIFYEYLVNLSEVEQTNEYTGTLNSLIRQINNTLEYRNKNTLPQALISDLIKDAKIILFNCIANKINGNKKGDLIKKIFSNNKIEEETYVFCKYEMITKRMYESMQDLIKTLEQYQVKCQRNN